MPIAQAKSVWRWIVRSKRQAASVLACAAGVTLILCGNQASGQEVTLPLADYESLRRRATPPAPEVATDAPLALERARLELRVGESSARLSIDLELTIYGDEWQTVPLPSDGHLTSVVLGSLEGRVSSEDGRVLHCRGAGRHRVRLNVVIPVTREPLAARPTRHLATRLPDAGVVSGIVHSDAAQDEIVLVSGALPHDTGDPETRGFVGNPGSQLELTLLGPSERADASELPMLFEAVTVTTASIARGRIDVRGVVHLDVFQGRMGSLRLRFPPSMSVLSVERDYGAELGWEAIERGIVEITPLDPMEGACTIALALAQSAKSPPVIEELEAPLLIPEGAARLSLFSGVSVDRDGVPILLSAGTGRAVDPKDHEALSSQSIGEDTALFAVRGQDDPPRWRIEWAEASQGSVLAAQVDRLTVDVLVGESGQSAFQYWASVRSRGAMSLTVGVPEGFRLTEATRAGQPITPGHSPRAIEIPLSAGPEPQLVHVTGLAPMTMPRGRGVLDLPVPSMSAPVARVQLRAILPRDREYEVDVKKCRCRGIEEARGFGRSASTESASASSVMSLLPVPSGHRLLVSSWNALSFQPRSLSIRVKSKRNKRRWF